MSIINKTENSTNITRYYKKDSLKTIDAVVKWLSELKDISGLGISYIILSDLQNRSDEGSDNCQLSGDAGYNEIKRALNQREIDLISAYGSYDWKPVVIGVDINKFEIYITRRKNDRADINAIEEILELC